MGAITSSEAERDHHRAARPQGEHHRTTAADAVGEVAAEETRARHARAVDRRDAARLDDREPAGLREVDRQERHDELADPVDERAGPEHPERARQPAGDGAYAPAEIEGHAAR